LYPNNGYWHKTDTNYRKVSAKQRITHDLFFRLFAWTIALLAIGVMSAVAATNSVTIAVTGDINPAGVKVVSDAIFARPEVAAVLLAGDTHNGNATPLEAYQTLYKGTYDRFLEKIYPCPGNHDEHSKPPFSGYCAFWGKAAHAPEMYYSFDLGGWHFICLDSVTFANGSDANSDRAKGKRAKEKAGNAKEDREKAAAQLAWLKSDLAANPNKPIFVQWHYPFFSSGKLVQQYNVKPFWDALYVHGPAIVLNGHHHKYERYAPMTPDGQVVAETKGIQQFIISPGGMKSSTQKNPKVPSLQFHSGMNHVGYFTLYPDGGYCFTIDSIDSSGKTAVIDTGCGNLLGGPVPQNTPASAVSQ